jgi:chemotaxis methyl-accepting protein methylase
VAWSSEEWEPVAALLETLFGLRIEASQRLALERRFAERLSSQGFRTTLEYCHYLKFNPSAGVELTELRETITNGETYFFRERSQLDALKRHVVPSFLQSGGARSLRILCAGCSSGEEAYSIVMSLQATGLERAGRSWEVDAFDLSPIRLARARLGVYPQSAFRGCGDEVQKSGFTAKDDGFHLAPVHRIGARFFEHNLVSPQPGDDFEPYDVIFCRNVLIYFSESGFHRALSFLRRQLRPQGYLFLGASESLFRRREDFEPVRLGETIVYRKVESIR